MSDRSDSGPSLDAAAPRPVSRWDALDGLRAVGVVLVVLFHTGAVVGNGFLGVDIFFVLSGFLITTLLVAETGRRGAIDLRGFYVRRARRLVPALASTCGFVVAVAFVSGRQVVEVVQGAMASLLYVSNLWLYSGHDTPLLQHTWTLALETQFYLVWPLVLGVVLRRRGFAAVVLLGWVLAAAVLPVLGVDPVAGTYLRAVGLGLGCAVALVLRGQWASRARRVSVLVAPLALGVLVALALLPGSVSVPQLLPAVLTVPVVVALTGPGRLTAVLQRPAPVWLGRRSYGLYLWHFPILSLAINHAPMAVPEPVLLVAAVLVSVAVAALSYRYVELPFLRRRSPV
jgi:peptidoglycan/LPS O-acetylase OafA/YrhL